MAGYDSMLPPRWAYRIVDHACSPYDEDRRRKPDKELQDELNSLGSEGWELVAAIPMIRDDVTSEIRFVFKRRDE
jgi:hypothetical protein